MVNGLYKHVTDKFNVCNELSLTSVTKNLCKGRLRSPLPEVHIGNRRCGGQPRGRPGDELKQPLNDRTLIVNGLYKHVTDKFNVCNELSLTSVTKNLCNGRLRSPLPEVHIGNGHCGGQPRGRPGALMCNGRQTTAVTDVSGYNGR
jgi:hypothetical protein